MYKKFVTSIQSADEAYFYILPLLYGENGLLNENFFIKRI